MILRAFTGCLALYANTVCHFLGLLLSCEDGGSGEL
jgi:hypothetical protein